MISIFDNTTRNSITTRILVFIHHRFYVFIVRVFIVFSIFKKNE